MFFVRPFDNEARQKWYITLLNMLAVDFFSNIDNYFWCNVNKDLDVMNRITDSGWFLNDSECLFWSILGKVINKTETKGTCKP